MAVKTGRATTVWMAYGALAITAEPTTDVGGAHTIYQITDTDKRRLAPFGAITVYKNGLAATATDYTVDYPQGKVTFSTPLTTEVVTIDAYRLTEFALGEFRAASVEMGYESADGSYFGDTGARMIPTIPYCRVTLDQVTISDTDLTNLLAQQSVYADRGVTTGIPDALMYLEIALGGSSEILRGYFVPDTIDTTADHKALITSGQKFNGVIVTPIGRTTEQCLWSLS